MREEPPDAVTSADRAELDALRRRAFAPDADIAGDEQALRRLAELEELVRRERLARIMRRVEHTDVAHRGTAHPGTAHPGTADPGTADPETPHSSTAHPDPAHADPAHPDHAPDTPPRPRRAALVVGVAVLAAILGGAAWSATTAATTAASDASSDAASDAATRDAAAIPVVSDEPWSNSSRSGYELFLDHLRGEVLATPGLEELASRLVRDSLRPYGTIYGRSVWTGSTTDSEYCMIVSDPAPPATVCTSTDPAYASEQSIVLPATNTTIGAAGTTTYVLRTDGRVVAGPTGATLMP